MRTRARHHHHESNESFLPIVGLMIVFICGGLALIMYESDSQKMASVYVQQRDVERAVP
ncbi:hypothetical protein [Rhizobium sp. LC145]|jgi:hypothetical protein|uniref:hypothetical protein n=1 Tax=Rhizobium sp. LC145 TaxID=1120688 RepID=UPI000B096508|nr:hypothetical protein [Rhizobium sp. LC145]